MDLVTGGAGFIGRHVVAALTDAGRDVRVLDSAPGAGLPPDVEIVTGAAADPAALGRAMMGIERVFHIAGDPQLWAPRAQHFIDANVATTEAVLAAAARHGVARTVVTSTAAIHFTVQGKIEPEIEDMPGGYARSKFLAERAALEAARGGAPVVILAPCPPIGPGDRNLTPPGRMILDFLNGRNPAYVDFPMRAIDVRDLARAYVLAAERGAVGARYFLGGEAVPLSRLLGMLERLTGLAMPRRRAPYALAHVAATISEAISDHITGRPPTVPLAGVRMTRRPARPGALETAVDLGLDLRPLEETLADAVRWFAGQGLLTRTRAAPAR